MSWFHRPPDEERKRREAAQQEARQSQAAIESGGIPLQARRRLDDLRAQGGRFFTSDLTVDEFALTRHAGFRPLSQVMGSSIYHVGWQSTPGSWGMRGFNPFGVSQELTTVSAALNNARRLALQRLEEEARLAGADAVVGVHVSRATYDWGQELVEFNAVGTAVRLQGAAPAAHPSLTNLSGQDFWTLLQAGYWPLGVVAASTVYYVVAGWQTQQANSFWGGWANQELEDFTRGFYDARHRAMSAVHRQAREESAEGVVGMAIEQHQRAHEVELGNDRKRQDMIVTFDVVGTAIQPIQGARPLSARTLLDLRS